MICLPDNIAADTLFLVRSSGRPNNNNIVVSVCFSYRGRH